MRDHEHILWVQHVVGADACPQQHRELVRGERLQLRPGSMADALKQREGVQPAQYVAARNVDQVARLQCGCA